MDNKKILIAENKDAIKHKLDAAKFLADACTELADNYKQLGLGEFTEGVFIDAIWNGANATRKLYVEKVKNATEFSNAFVSMREDAIKAAEIFANPFAQRAEKIRRWASVEDRALLKYLTFGSNGVELTEQGAAAIAESCKTYLTDADEIAKYEQHAVIVEMLNKLFDDGATAPLMWWRFFPMQNGKFAMPETPCNYAELVNRAKTSNTRQ